MGRLMVSLPLQATFVAPGVGMLVTDACRHLPTYSQSFLCRLVLNEICTLPLHCCAGTLDSALQPLHTTST